MRVDLDAQVRVHMRVVSIVTITYVCSLIQVLSESVSKPLTLSGGDEAEETAHFILMMDKFFDCLNVRNFTHGIHAAKPFQKPYWSAEDEQLKVCIRIHL